MRRILDACYEGAAWIAALLMIALLGLVVASIASRLVGINLPGLDAYAGYCLAGASFLALASTFVHGGHIRVELLLGRLPAGARIWAERVCLLVALTIVAAFAWVSVQLCWTSYEIHDLSVGDDATPLWIPQLGMALGTLVFLLAVIDRLVQSFTAPATTGAVEAHFTE